MDIINPFKPNPKKEENKLRQDMKQYERDTIVTENATHPQSVDEQEWRERQDMLSEIRRWLLDLAPKYQNAFEELSGMRFTDNGEAHRIPYVTPLIDIHGAYHLINFVKIIDHNVMRSNYSDVKIGVTLRYGIGYPLVSLVKNLSKAGHIEKKKAVLDYLVHYCFNLAEPTFYHALNDGERRHESQIHKIVETKNVLPKEEKKGLFKKD